MIKNNQKYKTSRIILAKFYKSISFGKIDLLVVIINAIIL